MGHGTAVFLDTTILIAKAVHAPGIKERISQTLKRFDFRCSGLVARQEYKRRLLKDARYLHQLAQKCDSIQEVNRHISRLPPQSRRKFTICFDIICTIDEMDNERDRLDRLRLFTLDLLRHSLRRLERDCEFFRESGCACGAGRIVERKGSFDFGPDHCGKTGNECRIDDFLKDTRSTLVEIAKFLSEIPGGTAPGQKSKELQTAETFIQSHLQSNVSVRSKDPCTCVGDLLIALESKSIPHFYTMNGRESQHLCKVLQQTLHVRPTNPDCADVECPSTTSDWPKF